MAKGLRLEAEARIIRAAARQSEGEVRLSFQAKPKSARDKLTSDSAGERLVLALTAPPVDGQANKALIALLAGALGVPKSYVRLVRGETSRHKEVAIAGLTVEDILERLCPDRGDD